jgi:hypothetical protein
MKNDRENFTRELASVINRHNVDTEAQAPDYVLAVYLLDCLNSYVRATRANEYLHSGPVVPIFRDEDRKRNGN